MVESKNKTTVDLAIEKTDLPLWVEGKSRMICEVQFYEDFAMLKPVLRDSRPVFRLPLKEFYRNYEEFEGDYQALTEYLRNEIKGENG